MTLVPAAAPPSGWRLTVPVVNLSGPQRNAGTWIAAIPDREAARKAIPFGRAVPSARLSPVTPEDLERHAIAPGEIRKIL